MKVADKADWVVWFDAVPVDGSDSNQVMVVVGLGHTLPKEVIDLGKQAEVVYSNFPVATKAQFPKEGKWVREYVTEGFLYEFIFPVDQKLGVVPRKDLLNRLDDMMRELCDGRFKR